MDILDYSRLALKAGLAEMKDWHELIILTLREVEIEKAEESHFRYRDIDVVLAMIEKKPELDACLLLKICKTLADAYENYAQLYRNSKKVVG